MSEAGWHAVKIVLDESADPEGEQADLLSALLFEEGMQGLEVRDQADPPELIASFGPETDPQGLLAAVGEALTQAGLPFSTTALEAVEPIDWETHWRAHFVPLRFGRLWVVPSWLEVPEEAQHYLRIDPSSAFGTGLHATTALCLERIDELSPVGAMLDVGTGTGVLAMAALALGAHRAVGTDNDPEALRVAAENAEGNSLGQLLTLRGDDVTAIEERFELVVANILAGPLVDMAPGLADRVAPGGRLILSGVLGTQAEEVSAAYVAAGLTAPVITARDEWVRIELEREAA